MEGNTENIAVNMNVATLSQIELLVDLGYYSDTNDFINQSVRQALEQKTKHTGTIGTMKNGLQEYMHLPRTSLSAQRKPVKRLKSAVMGL